MATKQELDQLQKQQAFEQSQLVGYWSKTKGITQKDFEQHPRIDDIILLIRFRDALWSRLNQSERGCWAGYWSSVYVKKNKLKTKALKKLEQITITAEQRHLQNIIHQAKQTQQIRSLRQRSQNPDSKSSAYMTAKSEEPAQTAPWE
jgi:hypothetical protein